MTDSTQPLISKDELAPVVKAITDLTHSMAARLPGGVSTLRDVALISVARQFSDWEPPKVIEHVGEMFRLVGLDEETT